MSVYQKKPAAVYAEKFEGVAAPIEAWVNSLDPARLVASGASDFTVVNHESHARVSWTQTGQPGTSQLPWQGVIDVYYDEYLVWESDWTWRFMPVREQDDYFLLALEPATA